MLVVVQCLFFIGDLFKLMLEDVLLGRPSGAFDGKKGQIRDDGFVQQSKVVDEVLQFIRLQSNADLLGCLLQVWRDRRTRIRLHLADYIE